MSFGNVRPHALAQVNTAVGANTTMESFGDGAVN